jgi:hypothetical protein
MPRYHATINGLGVTTRRDDVFNWDGKHDEVFLPVNPKVVGPDGTVQQNLDSGRTESTLTPNQRRARWWRTHSPRRLQVSGGLRRDRRFHGRQ